MMKRYKYRICPTKNQKHYLDQVFGCARVVYNDLIYAREQARKENLPYPSLTMLSSLLIKEAKRTPERAWLADVSSVVLQQSLRDADKAYKNYFNGLNSKNKVGKPKYKTRKNSAQSVQFVGDSFSIRQVSRNRAKLRLARFNTDITMIYSRSTPSPPSSVRIFRETDGKYYASFVVDVPEQPLIPVDRVTGIDLGLDHLAVLVSSDGTREKIDNPRYYRQAEKKLVKAQQQLSRKQKDSKNRDKARQNVARKHKKISNKRLDHAHKLAHRVVHENQVIALETLNIKGLARTRLSKSITDAGWSILTRLIAEKAMFYDREVLRISQYEPTSQVCSVCGIRSGRKPLSVRVWECPDCGSVLDRDYNAALNIMLAAGLAESLNARGGICRYDLSSANLNEARTRQSV